MTGGACVGGQETAGARRTIPLLFDEQGGCVIAPFSYAATSASDEKPEHKYREPAGTGYSTATE